MKYLGTERRGWRDSYTRSTGRQAGRRTPSRSCEQDGIHAGGPGSGLEGQDTRSVPWPVPGGGGPGPVLESLREGQVPAAVQAEGWRMGLWRPRQAQGGWLLPLPSALGSRWWDCALSPAAPLYAPQPGDAGVSFRTLPTPLTRHLGDSWLPAPRASPQSVQR